MFREVLKVLLICAAAICMAIGLASGHAEAQWITRKTPGIPRTPDGKPDLTAPAPKQGNQPDFSVLWRISAMGYPNQVTTDLDAEDVDPTAASLFNERQDNLFVDDPATFRCVSEGPRLIYGANVGSARSRPDGG
jgi:hypothetical protein